MRPPASPWQEEATLAWAFSGPGQRPGCPELAWHCGPYREIRASLFLPSEFRSGGRCVCVGCCRNTFLPLICLLSNSALFSELSQAYRGLPGGLGICPVSLGAVGSWRSQPVTSGSFSPPVAGSWGGSRGAVHLSPGCPSLPLEGTHLP